MSLAQLSQLLPLPEEDLRQVLDYAATLSKPEAAEHFNNLLGDSPLAVDFIASFNSHRKEPAPPPPAANNSRPAETLDAVPKAKRAPKKKKPAIHTPEARRVEDYAGPASVAYSKKDQILDYIPQRASAPSSSHASRSATPPAPAPVQQPPKQHASSAGFLISDIPSKSKAKSNPSSRSSTPKPSNTNSTKVSIAGGTPMAGQSTALADLDAAIRALEITTNPSLDNGKRRKCNCVATRHPLQSAAPNCLSCGKVICMKEGLGPCSFCGSPLLNPDDVQAMIRELKDERGRERMAVNASANRRAEVSKKPAPFMQPRVGDADDGSSLADAAAKAREHRDKLLNFQAQNARRTTVRDEAADFDVSGAVTGLGSMWASPEERAKELKRQQKLMREMEWNAQPDYEKRRQVLSIDLVGGKVVRKMAAIERPVTPESDEDEGVLGETSGNAASNGSRTGGGTFSANPLLGALLKPVYEIKEGNGKGKDTGEPQSRRDRKKGWRRVQDDLDDNEDVILDGGIHGHVGAAGDEPECG
ncbi:C2HC5 finger protein [Purpureocillium lilacinum]|uniref:C2HC5 finger protein n=1 Tax=Purpureocillium lilacinum TaxID=33203 RepID=A0A179GSF5_PURLI|nr:C2HC5 finger protein [Purpureocillium lilacinum]OAQ80865.1 C2HC5 finger protein [Purpureocillium lilacinum]